LLIYNIGGNRWCSNVGRQHQSNGAHAASQRCYTIRSLTGWLQPVVITPRCPRCLQVAGIFVSVDLKAGVWQQRCYDPDCRDYRSPIMPLPADALRKPRHVLISMRNSLQYGTAVWPWAPAHTSPRRLRCCAALLNMGTWTKRTSSCLPHLNSMRHCKPAAPSRLLLWDLHDRH
jgi:hypothetical protein